MAIRLGIGWIVGLGMLPSLNKLENNMKTFDVEFKEKMPTKEIEAKNEDEAKIIYLKAILKSLNVNMIDAIELDIVA